jgi:hypothetical protein
MVTRLLLSIDLLFSDAKIQINEELSMKNEE